VKDVSKGIGLDGRIGRKFLHPGPGFGGSCFPKDTLALVRTAEEALSPCRIVESVVHVNAERKKRMAGKIIKACGNSVDGLTIGILGLTFKPGTDDMRDAPSLDIIPILQEQGATVRAFDPEGMEEAKQHFDGVVWCGDAYETAKDADAVVILTEWNEFRALDLKRLKSCLKRPLMIDLRSIYDLHEMAAAGFEYHCVGRPYVPPVTEDEV
ncbi:MAG: UDP binding domain-containing protein, partial [bacterium]